MGGKPFWTQDFPIHPQLEIRCRKLKEFDACREEHLSSCNNLEEKTKSLMQRIFYYYFCRNDVISDLKLSPCFSNSSRYELMLGRLNTSCKGFPAPEPSMREPFACQ
ncbi:hypothetical protein ElyMa_002495700 [Elysia marginata]|uniref:Uncharacterized protein n=1 Tax=Elysia marginata TaxID=1093978 RepID=A0AAV4GQ78_9GAST|nr:hypothetical protein ElyMa_002495700 [Elysia marginata]